MSNAHHPYRIHHRPLTTWLPGSLVERFRAIAKAHGVTPATFLRAVLNDVLEDEAGGFSLYISPDGEVHYHAHLRVKTQAPSSPCVPKPSSYNPT